MTSKAIILTFMLGMSVFLATVFLWPLHTVSPDKGDRLAGTTAEANFLPERFGVPAPPQRVTPS